MAFKMNPLCAIDLQPIVVVLAGIVGVVIGWYLLIVVGVALIRAPIVTVAALLNRRPLDEEAAWVAFGELAVLMIAITWALFHFHIVKWG
jgi:hypothetical protein